MHLSAALFGFAVACLASLVLTPTVRTVARRMNLQDAPGERKIHRTPCPNIGGVALWGAVVLALLSVTRAFPTLPANAAALVVGIILGGSLIAVLGLIDDLRGVPPWKKLLVQSFAVVLLQLYADVLGQGAVEATWLWRVLAVGVALPWMLGTINAMNLIDGMDGLASGIGAIAGLGLFALSWAAREPVAALVAAILVGAALGFLRSNAYPAKIFMGDTGSMFLGFLLAAVGAVLFWRQPDMHTLAGLILISWVPWLDAAYALLRRGLSKENLFHADRGHLHHRLLDLGFSQRHAGLLLCGLAALGAVAGVQVAQGHHAWSWAGAQLLATLPLVRILRLRGARGLSGTPQQALAEGADALANGTVSHERAA